MVVNSPCCATTALLVYSFGFAMEKVDARERFCA